MNDEDPETIKIIAALVQERMKTAKGIVMIYNQKRRIPAEKGFFVDVAWLGGRPFGASSIFENVEGQTDLDEVIRVNEQETIQVDIFSYDDSARLRKIEIIYALNSVRAQQVMEQYAFKIARIPTSFVDVSQVQASKRLNRYALTFQVLRAYSERRAVETFTEFQIPPEILTEQ